MDRQDAQDAVWQALLGSPISHLCQARMRASDGLWQALETSHPGTLVAMWVGLTYNPPPYPCYSWAQAREAA